MNTQILFGKLHSWNTAVSKSMIFCLLLLRIWKLVQYCIYMAYCVSWNQRTIQNRWVVAFNSFRLLIVFNPPESNNNPNYTHFEHTCCLVWYRDKICQYALCAKCWVNVYHSKMKQRGVISVHCVAEWTCSSLFSCTVLYICVIWSFSLIAGCVQ